MNSLQSACTPAITTAALFIAVIILDLLRFNWLSIPGHALFGVFSTVLVQFICNKAANWVAWSILAIPFVFILLAYFFRLGSSTPTVIKDHTGTEWEQSAEECGCPCCHQTPCSCLRACWKPKPWPAGCKPKTE